jgi:Ca2+-binding EF-hand superfamily protein
VSVSFEDFDRNGDGYLSTEEATPLLRQQWNQLDTNRDGVLERSEFAAFETQMEGNVGLEPPSRPSPVAR